MTEDVVIAKLRKNAASEVWIVLKTYGGKRQCDIREYFHPADNPSWLPTKKGVSFTKEILGKAIDAAEELATRASVAEVAEIPRGTKAKTCFAIREFQRHVYGDIRMYYKEQENGDWKHGKGVTLPLGLLDKLVEALHVVEDQI